MPNEIENTFGDAIDFKRLFTVLQRWLWLFILGAIISAASAVLFSARQTPVYEATTNILVNRSSQQPIGDMTQPTMNLPQLVETYVRMLSLDEFLAIASQRLGYDIDGDNIKVSALQNTQIIELRVQDTDPLRAARIADTMVVVLAERNETLQASRYADAEANLDAQIKEIEARIAEVQTQLDAAKDSALIEQVTQAKANIDATVTAMNITQVEVERMETEMSWESARFRLHIFQATLVSQQASLDQQIAARGRQEAKLSDPAVQADPKRVAEVQARMAEWDKQIEATRTRIEDTQKEIIFLTPLDTEAGFDKTLVEKQNLLTTQQYLLASYQDVYTGLLSTEEVKRTTNEIDNAEKNMLLYQEIYVNLLNSLEDVKKQKMQNIPTIEQVSPSVAGEFPVKPRTLLNTLLGGLAGLILAASVVVLRETTDDTIKDREEVEKILG
ncbi:MAG: Wzz/FepE/Etk N-terminal domain-containing protein [Anaerolineales bacterium]|nr:Wzz/FepE/Etk N-terminal domain-containing protein [Anaerolineales bacterium]